MFVGDVLLSAREAVPDLPGVIPAPGANDLIFNQTAGAGNPLPVGNYFLVATYVNLWGETSPGPETQIQVTLGNAILVSLTQLNQTTLHLPRSTFTWAS